MARILANMEQAELAEAIGASRTSISNYETGKTEPTATLFVMWARATGADLEWLAEGIEKAPNLARGSGLSVHPPGLEPGTHWLRASGVSTVDDLLVIWAAEDVVTA